MPLLLLGYRRASHSSLGIFSNRSKSKKFMHASSLSSQFRADRHSDLLEQASTSCAVSSIMHLISKIKILKMSRERVKIFCVRGNRYSPCRVRFEPRQWYQSCSLFMVSSMYCRLGTAAECNIISDRSMSCSVCAMAVASR